MLVSIAFLALIQAVPVETGDNNLRVTETVEHFDVPGRNYRAFYRNLDDYGPMGRFSYYNVSMNFEFSFYQTGDRCQIEGIYVYVDHTYNLPQWDRYEGARARDRELFDDLYNGERSFLEGYATLSQTGGAELLEDLRGLEKLPCTQAQHAATQIGRAWNEAIDDAMQNHEDSAPTVPLRDTVCRQTGSLLQRCRD